MAVTPASTVLARASRTSAPSSCSPSSIGTTVGITFVVTLLSSKALLYFVFLVLRKLLCLLVWLGCRPGDRVKEKQSDCEQGIPDTSIQPQTYAYYDQTSDGFTQYHPAGTQQSAHPPQWIQAAPQESYLARTLSSQVTPSHTSPQQVNSLQASSLQDPLKRETNHSKPTPLQVDLPRIAPSHTELRQTTPPQGTLSQNTSPQTTLPQALLQILPQLQTCDRKGAQSGLPEPAVSQGFTYGNASLEKKPFCQPLERFNSTSKTALVQDLTRPQHSVITAAPVHVTERELEKDGSWSAYVNPFEVEHNLNSTMFPVPNSTISPVQCAPQHEHTVADPPRPVSEAWNEPVEMDVGESQFDYSNSSPVWTINGVPHRWDSSLWRDKRVFHEDHDLSKSSEAPPEGEGNYTQHISKHEPEMKQVDVSVWKPRENGYHAWTDDVRSKSIDHTVGQTWQQSAVIPSQICNKNRDSSSSCIYTDFNGTHSIANELQMGYQNTPTVETATFPTCWDTRDVPCTPTSALSQERRFFEGFKSTSTEPLFDILPDMCLSESGFAVPDMNQSPIDNLDDYASLKLLHRLDTTQIMQLLFDGPSISSTGTSPDTGGSIFSASSTSTTSVSTASTESLPNITDVNPPWTCKLQSPAQLHTEPVPSELLERCPDCAMRFATQGKLSVHYNSVHNRRFPCGDCARAFGLKLDLERHKHTIHKDLYGPLATFTCTNLGCATPRRTFHRKDNFRRHVQRCQQAVSARRTRR